MEFDNLKQLALYTKNTPLPGYTFPNLLYLLTQKKIQGTCSIPPSDDLLVSLKLYYATFLHQGAPAIR